MICRGERGLALLLVVSLMALVTLIVVSLALVTRLETRVGNVQSEAARARQNAMVGLEMALGRLQSAAGPDCSAVNFSGGTSVPAWDPSQNGCDLDRPQRQLKPSAAFEGFFLLRAHTKIEQLHFQTPVVGARSMGSARA